MVPLSELEPLRVPAEPQDPEPLPYLREPPWAYDIPLEIELNGAVVARSNARHLYWSIAQQIAHLTSNGASLRVGDLLGQRARSRGPSASSAAACWSCRGPGSEPIELPDGSARTFLEDGDEVVLRGEPLGEVRGRIVAGLTTRGVRSRRGRRPPADGRRARAPGDYAPLAGGRAVEALQDAAAPLRGARVLHVSAAGAPGPVPELLGGVLPLAAGAGLAVEWRVLFADPDLRRVGAALEHGLRGGESAIQSEDWEAWTDACERIGRSLNGTADLVVLHDAGTLGLAAGLDVPVDLALPPGRLAR